MTNRIFAFTLIVALSGSVLSGHTADLAPGPMTPSLTYNWTGIYLGVNGGGSWGQQDPLNIITDRFDEFGMNISGGMFGGTIGAQAQAAHVVIGLESDLDWTGITGSGTGTTTLFGAPLGTFDFSTKMKWIGTFRARAGYAQDNWLFYVTGGAALIEASTNVTNVGGGFVCGTAGEPFCSGDRKKVGGIAGVGVEYGITPNLSAKLEYNYIAAVSLEIAHVNTIKAGLNYRFGGL
jgi:outer membrane immunogenic protein